MSSLKGYKVKRIMLRTTIKTFFFEQSFVTQLSITGSYYNIIRRIVLFVYPVIDNWVTILYSSNYVANFDSEHSF